MARKTTVRDLAREAEADLDETLVALWDAGFDVVEPEAVIERSDLRRARLALGIHPPREQLKIEYWLNRTGLSRVELASQLAEIGISLPAGARVLPKGALRRLRRRYEFVSPAADPVDADETRSHPPCPPLAWQPVGTRRDIEYLSQEDVLDVHNALVVDFAEADDPIEPPGVRSENLLSSAVHRPMTSLGPDRKYPTVEMAGAALLHSLVLNHAFHNGNKRTGLVSALVFLDRNGVMATCGEAELFRFVLQVAQHGLIPGHCDLLADREVLEMATWLRRNSRSVDKAERTLPWHRLKRILRGFSCTFDHTGSVGNRINIHRTVEGSLRPFGRKRSIELHTQVYYAGEGRSVEQNTVHKIRADLLLDETHGVDSKVFYEAQAEPDDFIQQYRVLLRRLGRL